MTTTPSKQTQEAEGNARAADGTAIPPNETTIALEGTGDGAPQDPGGDRTQSGAPDATEARQPPPARTPADQRRDEIRARFRAERSQQTVENTDQLSDFMRADTPPEFAPEPEPQDGDIAPDIAPVEPPKTLRLKVNGKEMDVPVEEVIAKAQIAIASDGILDKAKSKLAEVDQLAEEIRKKAAQPGPDSHHADPKGPQPEADSQELDAQNRGDGKKLVEAIQFGDPEEAERLLDEEINRRTDAKVKTTVKQELLQERLQYSGRPGILGQPEASRFSVTRRETWQFCRSERDRVCIYFHHSTCGRIDVKLDARRDLQHFILAVVVVAIVMVVVSSIAHIKASTRMVPVPMSFADSNSNAANSDIGAFRDDHWFVADVQRTGKYRIVRNGTRKRANTAVFMSFSWMRRSPSRYSPECALGIPVVCIELTSSILEMVLERTWFRDALIRSGSALQRSNNQMSGHDGHRTIRDLEQYIDGVVALHTQQTNNEEMAMDKDRIKGSAEQAKGAVKETAGKVFGDKRLETEGKADKAAGKVQNAIGGLKDAVRGK